jgi:hypothetical protein
MDAQRELALLYDPPCATPSNPAFVTSVKAERLRGHEAPWETAVLGCKLRLNITAYHYGYGDQHLTHALKLTASAVPWRDFAVADRMVLPPDGDVSYRAARGFTVGNDNLRRADAYSVVTLQALVADASTAGLTFGAASERRARGRRGQGLAFQL